MENQNQIVVYVPNASDIAIITKGSPLREYVELDQKLELCKALAYIALTYMGIEISHDNPAVIESAATIRKKFGSFKLGELRLAFQMAACGQLDTDKKKVTLTAYQGKFTVEILGKVLAAYDEHRLGLLKQVRKLEDEREQQEQDRRTSELNESYRQSVILEFDSMVARGHKFDSLNEIPLGWYLGSALVDSGRITTSRSLWNAAKRVVARELRLEAKNPTSLERLKSVKQMLDEGVSESAKAKSYYSKFVIFQTLKKNARIFVRNNQSL